MRAWSAPSPAPMAHTSDAAGRPRRPEPGPDELLVRVDACGAAGPTCTWSGDLAPGQGGAGHQVSAWWPRAATRFLPREAWHPGCAHCGDCRCVPAGAENLCPSSRYTAGDADGGFAEYAAVPAALRTGCPTTCRSRCRARCCVPASSATGPAPRRCRPRPVGDYRFRSSAHVAAELADRARGRGARGRPWPREPRARRRPRRRLSRSAAGQPAGAARLGHHLRARPAAVPLALAALQASGQHARRCSHVRGPAARLRRHLFPGRTRCAR